MNITDDLVHSTLSAEERERASRFRFPRDRDLFAYAHIFLRTTLARYTGAAPGNLRFETGKHGRPELVNRAIRFNLSHTLGMVACVVTETDDCGVDVEGQDRTVDPAQLARMVLAPDEIQQLSGISGDNERRRWFLRVWTLKEAYLKAKGIGLGQAPHEFAIACPPDHQEWQFWSGTAETGHLWAVARRTGGAIRQLQIFNGQL